MKHSKKLAVFYSLLPGAGHMYLGLTTQGIQLMLLFLFIFYISTALDMGFFGIFLPIIWFYAIFDAWGKASSEEPLVDSNLKIFDAVGLFDDNRKGNTMWKFIGCLLLISGAIFLLNNTVFPLLNAYLDYTIVNSIRSVLISGAMIVIGLLIIFKGGKNIHTGGDSK